MQITIGSFYSGAIDGFALAALKNGFEIKWNVEADSRAWKYLKQNYPPPTYIINHDTYASIKTLEPVHIIAGGDPCQPHSSAGQREGFADNRYRWPFMLKAIQQLKPDWVINENVVGSISNLVLDQKITDLENAGYSCQAYVIPAVALNAHHERKRVFLVANSNGERRRQLLCTNTEAEPEESPSPITLGAQGNAFLQFEERFCEPAILPVANGIPDHIFRLQAAGQSIIHQIPMIIFKAIKTIYENEK